MTEDEKMQVAVFRFGVISEFVTGTQISRAEKRRLMREKSARKWQIPFSEKTSITMGTISPAACVSSILQIRSGSWPGPRMTSGIPMSSATRAVWMRLG